MTAPMPRVANLAEAAALLGAYPDKGLELWSPERAAEVQGVLWFVMLQHAVRADFPDRDPVIVLDCGDRGDLAIEAFRLGLRSVALNAPPGVTAKVAEVAAAYGGQLHAESAQSLA